MKTTLYMLAGAMLLFTGQQLYDLHSRHVRSQEDLAYGQGSSAGESDCLRDGANPYSCVVSWPWSPDLRTQWIMGYNSGRLTRERLQQRRRDDFRKAMETKGWRFFRAQPRGGP